MTAMSASERAANDSAELADRQRGTETPVPIRIPGSPRTYEIRETLRLLGLRWDPVGHAWHGVLSPELRVHLERRLGTAPRVVRPLEAFIEESTCPPNKAPRPPAGPAPPLPVGGAARSRDGSRTHVEARISFPRDAFEGTDDDARITGTRFTWRDVTSGLPDDSREADEREEERRLRDLRGRVKAARAALAAVPGAAEVLATDWVREARFLARWGITEAQLRHGASKGDASNEPSDPAPCDVLGGNEPR
jgi:hypothetical protein